MKIMKTIIHVFILILAMMVSGVAFAQNSMTVTGSVKDTSGEPIIGAAVMVEGTTTGVVTDIDGNYSISFTPKEGKVSELSFASISYLTQVIAVGDRSVIDVVLEEDLEELDEVVVVGYGAMRKSDITGSVTSVKIDENIAQHSASVDQLLHGQAAGVQVVSNSAAPDASVNVTIRGASSFNSDSQPLYVVDGVIMNTSGSMSMGSHGGNDAGVSEDNNGLIGISPQDIASMEILKDASATAIYGSQGANGVVLITTKAATKEKPSITFTSGVSLSNIYKKYDLLDAEDYLHFLDLKGILPTDAAYSVFFNPAFQPVDWQDYATRMSVTQRYFLTVAGRPQNTNYRFSVGYFDNQGVIKGTGYTNITARLNLDRTIGKFSMGTKTSFSYLDSRMTQGAGGTIAQTPATSMVMSMLLSRPLRRVVALDDDGYELNDEGSAQSGPDRWLSDYESKRAEFRVTSSIFGQYKILPWLTFKTTLGVDYRTNERSQFKSSRINTQATGSNGAIVQMDRMNWNWDNLLQFNKKIKRHRVSGMLGHSASQYITRTMTVEGTNVDQWKAMSASLNSAPYNWLSYGESQSQLLSFFGRATYNYDERYVITATYRFDGSSKFDVENRWAQFPSFAAAWRISNEPWFKRFRFSFPAFTSAKLRLGWGKVGNQGIPSYQTSYRYTSSTTATHDNESHKVVTTGSLDLPSKGLKWETTSQYNIGLDLDFFKGRIVAAIDGYYKVTDDLLQTRILAGSIGVNNPYVNMGSISNTGFEITLNTVPVAKHDVEWTLGGNFTLNRNKILSIDPSGSSTAKKYVYLGEPEQDVEFFTGNKISSSAICNDYLNIFMTGHPMSLFYALPTNGIVQEGQKGKPFSDGKPRGPGSVNFVDTNGDEVIDEKDRVVVGDPNPDFTYGFNTSLRYKRFTLTAAFIGSYGNDVFNQQLAVLGDLSTKSENRLRSAVYDAWSPGNPNAEYPSFSAFTATDLSMCSDRFVEDGSYLRLSNASLSYSVPIKNKKALVKHLSFTVSGKNLFCITNYSGYDPDVNIYGTVLKYGIDMGAYPAARTYMFDVKISF